MRRRPLSPLRRAYWIVLGILTPFWSIFVLLAMDLARDGQVEDWRMYWLEHDAPYVAGTNELDLEAMKLEFAKVHGSIDDDPGIAAGWKCVGIGLAFIALPGVLVLPNWRRRPPPVAAA